MSSTLYDHDHVAISRLLGREHNNPLGDAAFPLLRRLVSPSARPDVLDAGCGRGRTACWWAKEAAARVDAFDPSPAMLDEAAIRAASAGVTERVSFQRADIAGFVAGRSYDLAIAHDVLCYTAEREKDAARLAGLLAPGGILSVSDYYRDGQSREVEDVLAAWGIHPPEPFERSFDAMKDLGLDVLFHFDTTRHYRRHWEHLRGVLERQSPAVRDAVGDEALRRFAGQIDAILRAVKTGEYGHCWTIWELRR